MRETENAKNEKELARTQVIIVQKNKEIEKLKKDLGKAQRLAREIENVKAGWSFKIGRAITFIPRQIKKYLK